MCSEARPGQCQSRSQRGRSGPADEARLLVGQNLMRKFAHKKEFEVLRFQTVQQELQVLQLAEAPVLAGASGASDC